MLELLFLCLLLALVHLQRVNLHLDLFSIFLLICLSMNNPLFWGRKRHYTYMYEGVKHQKNNKKEALWASLARGEVFLFCHLYHLKFKRPDLAQSLLEILSKSSESLVTNDKESLSSGLHFDRYMDPKGDKI